MSILREFEFEAGPENVSFMESFQVNENVTCDVYTFTDDNSKDLGIIKIQLGGSTPLQKVVAGERTVEGFVSGKGKLSITRSNGDEEIHHVDGKNSQGFMIDVGIGDCMQWKADKNEELVAFEICIPPYKDGRFENLK